MSSPLSIFLVVQPGLEPILEAEARDKGFEVIGSTKGGVTLRGGWPDVWRANTDLRGATRVLVRLAEFPAVHLAQLDKRARKLPWRDWLTADCPIRVDATCRKSKIYHHRAAAERVARAAGDAVGATIDRDATLTLKVRIEENLCTISLDTSGEALHKRNHKVQVNKAPMRETLAALFLHAAGFDGSEPVYDPMCGSGTFPIEAAEIACGLQPGRSRRFSFENFASFDRGAFVQNNIAAREKQPHFYGSDRDTGAIAMSKMNADRAGVAHLACFDAKPISDAVPPCDRPGLVIVNAPYGGRIGNKKPLYGLYASFGQVMRARFGGWRVALITSDAGLAKTTGLSFAAPGPQIDHGGIRIRLWQTAPI